MGHWQNRTLRCSGSDGQPPDKLGGSDRFESERKPHGQPQASGPGHAVGLDQVLLIVFALLEARKAPPLYRENPISSCCLSPRVLDRGVLFDFENFHARWLFLLLDIRPSAHPSLTHYYKLLPGFGQRDNKNVPSTANA